MTDDAKGGWCGRTLTGMRSLSLVGIRYHWCCWNVWSERESLPWRPFDWVWIPILHFLPLLPQTLCWVSHMKFKRKVKLENWKMIKTVPRHLVINTTCNACLCCCSCFLIAFNTFFAMEVFPPLVKSSFELPIWGKIWIQYSEFHSHPAPFHLLALFSPEGLAWKLFGVEGAREVCHCQRHNICPYWGMDASMILGNPPSPLLSVFANQADLHKCFNPATGVYFVSNYLGFTEYIPPWIWDFIQPKNCEISNSGGNIFCWNHHYDSKTGWGKDLFRAP